MKAADRHLLLVDGTAQEDREPDALKPGWFSPQERRLEDHLTLFAETAALAPFFRDDGGAVEGGWLRMLGDDPVLACARILSTPLDERRHAFETLLERDPGAALKDLTGTARAALELLQAVMAERRSTMPIGPALEHVRPDVDVVDEDDAEGWLRRLQDLEPDTDARAVMALMQQATGFDLQHAAKDPPAFARAARLSVRVAHEKVLGALASLRTLAMEVFQSRLKSGDMNPALGLAVAKLDALGRVEARMNQFTERHVDFYYRDVMGQRPRPGRRDRTHVILPPGPTPITARKGARLRAQASDGSTRIYELSHDVRSAPAQVAEMQVLRYRRDRDMRPQGGMGFVTSVEAGRIEPVETAGAAPRRLFEPPPGGAVEMGLRIASPVLWLAEGRRRISAAVRLTRRGAASARRKGTARSRSAGAASMEADGSSVAPSDRKVSDEELRDEIARTLLGDARLLEVFSLTVGSDAVDAVFEQAKKVRDDVAAASGLDLMLHGLLRLPDASPDAVRAVLGRAVSAALIEGAPWPSGAFRKELLDALGKASDGPEDVENAVRLFDTGRDARFQEVLGESFSLRLSTETGWMELRKVQVSPLPTGGGLRFVIVLDERDPPIAARPATQAPELVLALSRHARFSAVSMLEPYVVDGVDIAVQVRGLTRLKGFADDGPLDLSQPAAPFGPRPRNGAAFHVGCPELARKSVRRVGARIEWDGLPGRGDGLSEVYAGYGEGFEPLPEPCLEAAYLSGDGWKPLFDGPQTMFERDPTTRAYMPERSLEARAPGGGTAPHRGVDDAAFRRRREVSAGLLRLRLVASEDAFGHQRYPLALAQALRPTYLPLFKRETPGPPYTPSIASISIDYSARSRLSLTAKGAAAHGERIVRFGPFGETEVFPNSDEASPGLCPTRIADGALFLRLEGDRISGRISLLVSVEEASHRRRAFAPAPVTVRYLAAGGWTDMPLERIVMDTTDRLMRTGIITIDLPDDAAESPREMPGEGVWLAFCVDRRMETFPRLRSIRTNAGRADRVHDGGDAAAADDGPTAFRTLTFDPPIPGLGRVEQVGETFGNAAPESDRAFRTRMAERLRHRGRAVTAWDVERLLLEGFPEVWKAKCYPAFETVDPSPRLPGGGEAAGSMVVIVAPQPPADKMERPDLARAFDPLTLRRIKAMLVELATPFARIELRNPSFERLQLRATVSFESDADDGALAQQLKMEVARHLSVWTGGRPMNGFGWSVNLGDVGGFILSRPYVRSLSGLSMLHLVRRDDGRHELVDTARPGVDATLRPVDPWSLPLPMPEHWIMPRIAREGSGLSAKPAGIGGLRVGRTFVVLEEPNG